MDLIEVILAEDHPQVRQGLKKILENARGIEVVGEAENGRIALELVDDLRPDVLVLDVEMPIVPGIEVARRLQKKRPGLPVLAVSVHEDRQFVLGMLSLGASGYVTKVEAPELLASAVRDVALGERVWLSRRVAARLALWMNSEHADWISLTSEQISLLQDFLHSGSVPQITNSASMKPGLKSSGPSLVRDQLTEISANVRKALKEWL